MLFFKNFIRTFCDKTHPLVIFLDDLQWADTPSLNLIKLFMTSATDQYMLIIGAYRDNEVNVTHPLMMMLDEINKANATVNTLTLMPLNLFNTNKLVADTLHCDNDIAEPLARLCLQKTQGNPFFLNQFLHSMYEQKFIEFDQEKGQWQWDNTAISQTDMTHNVVDLMIAKLQKLPIETQTSFKISSLYW